MIEQEIESIATNHTVNYLILMSMVMSCSCTKLIHPNGQPQGYIAYTTVTTSSAKANITASTTYVLGAEITTTVKGY